MKILIVGLGSIAQKHIHSIREVCPNSEILALRGQGNSDTVLGVSNIYDLSNLVDVDFAIISNPTFKHANTISKLVPLNIPLFIEKPLFDKLDYDQLVAIIEEKRTPTYVACNLRFMDSLRYVKNEVRDKRINEVNVYCGSYLPSWRPNVDFRQVYSANKEMGGGVHIDLIHELDYISWIFGSPIGVSKRFTNTSSLKISAYDYANYLLVYDKFSINVVLNYYRKNPKRTLEVVCDDGEYIVDLLHNEVFWNGERVFISKQTINETYIAQMRYFLSHVIESNHSESMNKIGEAYNILKLCLED